MAEDPLRAWAEVTAWTGEIECELVDDHPILNASETNVVGAHRMRGMYRAAVNLGGPSSFSWSGEGDATGSITERSEVDASGFGFTLINRLTAEGGGSGTAQAGLGFAVDPATNRGVYDLNVSPLRVDVHVQTYSLSDSGVAADIPTEDTEDSAGTRLLSVPRIDDVTLPTAVSPLVGSQQVDLAGTRVATVRWRLEPVSAPAADPTPCGATIRILDFQNRPVDASMALSVSNHVADDRTLGEAPGFDTEAGDRDAFRVEIEDANADSTSVKVILGVGDRFPTIYELDRRSGRRYRGPFLRLVTDSEDETALAGARNVLCRIGEEVVVRYISSSQEACADTRRIPIARPDTENNNDHPIHLRHDIRRPKLHVVVFSRPGLTTLVDDISPTRPVLKAIDVSEAHESGVLRIDDEDIQYTGRLLGTGEFTGCVRGALGTVAAAHAAGTPVRYSRTVPSATRSQVAADLDNVDERLAQSGIRLRRPVLVDIGLAGDTGVALPAGFLDEFETTSRGTLLRPTVSEVDVVAFTDDDRDTIDVFYVTTLVGRHGRPVKAVSYRAGRNQTGAVAFQNFAVLSEHRYVFSLGHELMHILLDASHRDDEPATALFHWTRNTKAVDSTKRIGPYPDAETAAVGVRDTRTIRANAESLPT